MGQHFLTDRRIVERILAAANLSPDDLVVEVGPGRGVLTRRLVERVARVVAVEMDPQLAADLPIRLENPAGLEVVNADARTVDISALINQADSYKVVANLPYYAANPILRRFLEEEPKPVLLVVMLQREVAENMAAAPGKMGFLSVATQYYAKCSKVCNVPPAAFRPPPKVTSSVLRLELRPQPAVPVADPQGFFTLVRAGFSAPRKQLRNSVSHGLKADPHRVGLLLEAAGLDGQRRAQTLSIEEWAHLYRMWEEQGRFDCPSVC